MTRRGLARGGMGSAFEALVLPMSPYRVRPPMPPDADEIEWRRRQRRAEIMAWLRDAVVAMLEVVVEIVVASLP